MSIWGNIFQHIFHSLIAIDWKRVCVQYMQHSDSVSQRGFFSVLFECVSNINILMPMVFKLNEVNNKISAESDDRLHINKTKPFSRCLFWEKRFDTVLFRRPYLLSSPDSSEQCMPPKRFHNQDGLIMLSSLPFTGLICVCLRMLYTYTCSELVLEVAGLCQQKSRFSSPIYCCYYCCGCSHHNNIKLPLLMLLLVLFPRRHYFHVYVKNNLIFTTLSSTNFVPHSYIRELWWPQNETMKKTQTES